MPPHSCSPGIVREGVAGVLLDEALERGDEVAQILRRELGVQLGGPLLLQVVDGVLEQLAGDAHDDVAVHLHQAAVAIVSETLVAAAGHEALHGVVVEAEVEHGVHHPGHGNPGARAHREQQRVGGIGEALAHDLLDLSHGGLDLGLQLGGQLARALVFGALGGGDGEPGRDRHAEPRHLRQVGALAAEKIAHRCVAVSATVGEDIYPLVAHVTSCTFGAWIAAKTRARNPDPHRRAAPEHAAPPNRSWVSG